jgi:hypothetical protein
MDPCKAVLPGPANTPSKTSIMNEFGLTCHGVGARSLAGREISLSRAVEILIVIVPRPDIRAD